MYGAYWSNAAKKVQVPSASHLGNPGSALARMPSACCIDIPTRHDAAKKFVIQSYRIVEVLHLRIYYKINFKIKSSWRNRQFVWKTFLPGGAGCGYRYSMQKTSQGARILDFHPGTRWEPVLFAPRYSSRLHTFCMGTG